VTVWTSVGYLSGNHINAIYNTAKRSELYLAIAVAALLISYIARRLYQSWRKRTHPAALPHAGTPQRRPTVTSADGTVHGPTLPLASRERSLVTGIRSSVTASKRARDPTVPVWSARTSRGPWPPRCCLAGWKR
jgi:hypothetical protein